MAVGITYSEVEEIVKGITEQKDKLEETIESVESVSKTISATFSGEAGTAFQDTMALYKTKANEALPVLESICNWLNTTSTNYSDADTTIAGYFSIS
ncbi:MAG: WXG100 family type VII secretion target [Agathobacter sp.]|nr:WXG100 family type VII secretion target [Agathobacter sp.]